MRGKIIYHTIGVIYSLFKKPYGTPIQPRAAEGVKGKVVIKNKFKKGIKDLSGFSHIILIYHFHLSQGYSLWVKPFMDKKTHGVFATRAPCRPNSLGLSVVKLKKIKGNTLYIEDVDIVDGTPLLDIKPYLPHFDSPKVTKIGWLKKQIHRLPSHRDDGRFVKSK